MPRPSHRRVRPIAAVAVATAALMAAVAPSSAIALPPDGDPFFVQVDAGRFSTVVLGLTADGEVYSWGVGSRGQLGIGPGLIERLTPAPVALPALPAGDRVVQVSFGAEHALALTQEGTVLAWGANGSGQLGLGDLDDRFTPTAIPTGAFPGLSTAKIVAVSASGADHSLALSSSGQVFAWGWNGFGQLGDNSIADSTSPVRVVNSGTAVIEAGYGVSYAVSSAGVVTGWGYNGSGQLGDGSTTTRRVPTALEPFPGLTGGDQIVDVASGNGHAVAVSATGRVYAWGDDSDGQLGLGPGDDSRHAPGLVVVPGLAAGDRVISVDAGDYFSAALTADGALYSWGGNDDGQLGLGDDDPRESPVRVTDFPAVLDGSPLASVSAGAHGMAVVSSTGGVYGTGRSGGLLGDETAADFPISSFAPIRLADLAGSVTLSGTPRDGVTVSAVPADWNAGAVLAYRWQLDDVDIPGATSADYAPDAADVGHELRVVVTATAENHGAGSATSAALEVAGIPPALQTTSLPAATAGAAYEATVVATGTGPLEFSATLPAGLSIDPASGVISGSLTAAGTTAVEVTVENAWGPDTAEYSLVVEAAAAHELVIVPSTTSPAQGDTIEVTALGYDPYGNPVGDLTASTVFSSDVASDVIVGNRITFPHASPHTITALAGPASGTLLLEVSPAPAGVLGETGAAFPGWPAAAGAALVALGIIAVALAGRLGRLVRGVARES